MAAARHIHPDELKAFASECAQEAGGILRAHFAKTDRSDLHVSPKGGPRDLVTELDREVEALLEQRIRKRYPDHGVLAEEGTSLNLHASYRWIIDPLDGTTNFAHGFPFFAVAIGCMCAGQMQVGVVYNPVFHELFWAQLGRGAWLNDHRLRVSSVEQLDAALIGTGLPYEPDKAAQQLKYFEGFVWAARSVRRMGSAALLLSYVAAGRLDGYWEMNLKPWDLAAAALIIQEAGGRLTDFAGRPFDLFGAECLASNAKIHDQMVRVLQRRS